MKNLNITKAIRLAVALFALVTLATAYGQTSNVIRVTVPFEFRAGHGVMPSGAYLVQVDPAFGIVKLCSNDGAAMGFLPGHPGYSPAIQKSKLVFNEYGTARFLRKIEFAGGSVSYRLPESGAEREMAKLMTPTQVALVHK